MANSTNTNTIFFIFIARRIPFFSCPIWCYSVHIFKCERTKCLIWFAIFWKLRWNVIKFCGAQTDKKMCLLQRKNSHTINEKEPKWIQRKIKTYEILFEIFYSLRFIPWNCLMFRSKRFVSRITMDVNVGMRLSEHFFSHSSNCI